MTDCNKYGYKLLIFAFRATDYKLHVSWGQLQLSSKAGDFKKMVIAFSRL